MSGIRDSILPPLEWLSEQDPPAPAAVSDWLMELGSMTRRFERHCAKVRVEPQRECFVTREALGDEANHLPDSPRYWLREVVLLGDDQPLAAGAHGDPGKYADRPRPGAGGSGHAAAGTLPVQQRRSDPRLYPYRPTGCAVGAPFTAAAGGQTAVADRIVFTGFTAVFSGSCIREESKTLEGSVTQSKWRAYSHLMRIDKPIGTLLLLWPTLWALWLAGKGVPSLSILLVFVLGVFLMRAAGCVVNDYADRAVDGYVKRTAGRPMPSGRVSAKEAKVLFAVLVLISFCLVLTLNAMTIWLSLAALALAWCIRS